MVLTLIARSPWEPGFLAPIAALTSSAQLGLSVGRPGPHAFAVRGCLVRLTSARVHRIPRSTSVTIAKRPSDERGTAGMNHRLLKNGREIFFVARAGQLSRP